MASPIGEGFLYPAKPFNTINPTGMDAAQSIDVLQKDVMQRRELANAERDRQMKAQQADADRQAQLQESERSRQFEAGQRDKELNWSADQAKQQQMAAADEARKREAFEAGQNDKTRELQKQNMQLEREQSDRQFQLQHEETTHRNFMEATSLRFKALEEKRRAIEERKMTQFQNVEAEGALEHADEFDAIDKEEEMLSARMGFMTVLRKMTEVTSEAARADIVSHIRDAINPAETLINQTMMGFDNILAAMDKTEQQFREQDAERPGFWENAADTVGFVLAAGEAEVPEWMQIGGDEARMVNRASKRWAPVGEQLAAAAVGEFKPVEGSAVTLAGKKVSEFLAKLDLSVNSKSPEDAANAREMAAAAYRDMEASGMNMQVLDSALTGLYKMANGEGMSPQDMDAAANTMVKTETGATPSSGPRNASVAGVLRGIMSLKDEKGSPLAKGFGGKALVQFKSKDGKMYAYSQITEDAIAALVMVQNGMDRMGDVRPILEGAVDGDPSTFPVLAEMQAKLPPEVWSVVEKHISDRAERMRTYFAQNEGDKLLGLDGEHEQSYIGPSEDVLGRDIQGLDNERKRIEREKSAKIVKGKQAVQRGADEEKSLLDQESQDLLDEVSAYLVGGRKK